MKKAVLQSNIQSSDGGLAVAAGATITIRDSDTLALSTLYTDRDGGTTTSNPTTADADGFFRVYVNHGRYNITATFGAETQTFNDIIATQNIPLFQASDIASLKEIPPVTDDLIYIGYHTNIGDGGGGAFLGKSGEAPGTYTDDNGLVILPTGGDGSAAWVRQFEGDKVSPKWFGAQYDGTTDDTQAHKDAIASGYNVELPKGTTVISEYLIVPARQSFYGQGWDTIIEPALAGSWLSNFVIIYNSTDAVTWTVSTPGMPAGTIGRFRINNNSGAATTRGIFTAGSVNIENVRGQGLASVVLTSADYNDMVIIDRPTATNPQGSLYQIEVRNLGDGLRIQNYFCDDVTWPNTNALKVTGCRGGSISDSIGGNYYFDRCENLTFNGFHLETGVVVINESRMTLSSGEIFDNLQPRITISATNGDHHTTLDKVLFMRDIENDAADFNEIDVVVSTRSALTIRDCYTQTLKPSNLSLVELGGIIIGSDSSTVLTDYTNYSYLYSVDGYIHRSNEVGTKTAEFNGITESALNAFSGLTSTSNVTWKKATDTYFYTLSYIYDLGRAVGATDASERSLALTNAGSGALLTIGGARLQNVLVRVYRGTATGVYGEYADVPIIMTGLLYDNGETINGYKWQVRTPAAAAALTDSLSGQIIGGNIIMRRDSTSAPSQGTWAAGDQILDSAPSASSFIGTVCVTSGTPGTWKTFGGISA